MYNLIQEPIMLIWFICFSSCLWCWKSNSKGYMYAGRKKRSHWNSKYTTRVWQRLNYATNGNKLVPALMEITVNLLMESRNSAQSFAIHATKQKCAEWSLQETPALMATAAISAMLSPRRRNSWAATSTVDHRVSS